MVSRRAVRYFQYEGGTQVSAGKGICAVEVVASLNKDGDRRGGRAGMPKGRDNDWAAVALKMTAIVKDLLEIACAGKEKSVARVHWAGTLAASWA